MAATKPRLIGEKWTIDKDPDDKLFYVANVTKDLTDSGTTAVSYEPIISGVTLLAQAAPQGPLGGLLAVKLGGFGEDDDTFCTFRVTCANTEQFDRTIWFKRVSN